MSSNTRTDLPDDSDIFQSIMLELTQRSNAMQDSLDRLNAIQMALDVYRSYPALLWSILKQTEKLEQRDFYRNMLRSVLDDIHKRSAAVLAEHLSSCGAGDASTITTAANLCRRHCSGNLPIEPSTWLRYIELAPEEISAEERSIVDRAEGMTDQIRLWIDRNMQESPIEGTTQVEAPQAAKTDENSNVKTKGKNINSKMAEILINDKDADCIWWSVEAWSKKLNCSVSTIHGTRTWKRIMKTRAVVASEKENDKPDRRHYRKKKSNSE